jgi:hypothetical protein
MIELTAQHERHIAAGTRVTQRRLSYVIFLSRDFAVTAAEKN